MKSRFVCRLAAVIVLGLMANSQAWADLGVGSKRQMTPEQQKNNEKHLKELAEEDRQEELKELEAKSVPLAFRSDTKAPFSKLIIPRRLLDKDSKNQFKGAGEASGGEKLVQSADTTRTIVAGVALSLAISSVILLRKRSRVIKAVVIATTCGIGILAATTWSLAGAPKEKPERQPKANGRVIIEIVEDGDSVQFIRGKR